MYIIHKNHLHNVYQVMIHNYTPMNFMEGIISIIIYNPHPFHIIKYISPSSPCLNPIHMWVCVA